MYKASQQTCSILITLKHLLIISPHKNKPNKGQTDKPYTFLVPNTLPPKISKPFSTHLPSMATSKTNPPPQPDHHFYTPLPPQPQRNQNFTLLPYFYSPTSGPNWRVIVTLSLLLLAALVYIFWPSAPILRIERLHLTHIQLHTKPCICLDISMNVTMKVHNVDIYSMDYKTLDVAVGYRGKRLGHVKSDHGHVRALGSSYVEAELELECVKVLSDVLYLLEDLARGVVPIDTVTEFSGQLGIFFFGFPLKTKVSCEVVVNTTTQAIARQNCYPQ